MRDLLYEPWFWVIVGVVVAALIMSAVLVYLTDWSDEDDAVDLYEPYDPERAPETRGRDGGWQSPW